MRKPGRIKVFQFVVTGLAMLAVSTVGAARTNGLPRSLCSLIVPPPWVRGDPLTYLVIQASADTIPATVYRHRGFRLGYPADTRPPERGAGVVIHGQRVKILRAVGSANSTLPTPSTAALVEWSHDSMCQPVLPARPQRALAVPAGTIALLVAKPQPDTIAPPGVVVVHLYVGSRVYAPELERHGRPRRWHGLWPGPRMLTIEEYESLLRSLPTEAEWEQTPAQALTKLQAWAHANRSLASAEPARAILRGAREELAWRRAHDSTSTRR